MKYFIIFFLVLLFNYASSQEFSAIILDADNQPEIGVQIFNLSNQKSAISDEEGLFLIQAEPGDSLRISPLQKAEFFYLVPNYLSTEYEIYFINSEDLKTQQLEGVTITSDKIKPVIERFNANVIDYIPFKNGRLLTMCSLRNKQKLYIEANDQVIEEFDVDVKNFEELFIDVFGNYHLVCKDSTYQIVLSEKLININVITTDLFKANIKNIVFNDGERIVSSVFSNHKKAFRLISKSHKNEKQTIIHTVFDVEAFKQADQYYNYIIALYYAAVPYEHNLIANGVWDGKLSRLAARDDGTLIQAISWYKNVEGRKINVRSFSYNDSIIVFDFDNKTIKTLDYKGEVKKVVRIQKDVKMEFFEMLHDTITDNYFCFDPRKAVVELYQIDLNSGELRHCLSLDGVRFPKKPKVFNGWLYFIDLNDASFNKLYKVRLDN